MRLAGRGNWFHRVRKINVKLKICYKIHLPNRETFERIPVLLSGAHISLIDLFDLLTEQQRVGPYYPGSGSGPLTTDTYSKSYLPLCSWVKRWNRMLHCLSGRSEEFTQKRRERRPEWEHCRCFGKEKQSWGTKSAPVRADGGEKQTCNVNSCWVSVVVSHQNLEATALWGEQNCRYTC